MTETFSNTTQVDATQLKGEINLQRVYAEGSSEVPGAPEILTLQQSPHLDLQLNIQTRRDISSSANYVVELKATVTATITDSNVPNHKKTIFLVEVKQGGLFTIKGFDEAILDQILSIHCPTFLYPYACAFISDLIARGGFSPLYLPAVDFSHLYEKNRSDQSNGPSSQNEKNIFVTE